MAILSDSIVNGNLSVTDNIYVGGLRVATENDLNAIRDKFKGAVSGNLSGSVTLNDLDGITLIRQNAFYNFGGLTSIEIPNTVTQIGANAFYYCSGLSTVSFESGSTLSYIGNGAFRNCTLLKSISFGASLRTIESSAFSSSGLEGNISIPNSVVTIGQSAFEYCKPTTLSIGTGITDIGRYAFLWCSTLNSITIYATTPPTLANSNAFNSTNDCRIYVPSGSLSAYRTATNWVNLASRIYPIS